MEDLITVSVETMEDLTTDLGTKEQVDLITALDKGTMEVSTTGLEIKETAVLDQPLKLQLKTVKSTMLPILQCA